MTIDALPKPPRQTVMPVAARPSGSVRRTSSVDVFWPTHDRNDRLFIGRARDLVTREAGSPGEMLAQAQMEAKLDAQKVIHAIWSDPSPARIGELAGQRAGSHLRRALQELTPELLESGHPLYLPLDDLSGSALVSSVGWATWDPGRAESDQDKMSESEISRALSGRVDVCWGLKEGNSGTQSGGLILPVADADASDVRNPDDPHGWHDLPDRDGAGFRRARWIDVVRDEATGAIRIDTGFQDSAKTQHGGRVAIHEYTLQATADPETLEVLDLVATPHILPFSECPGAVANAQRMVGARLADIREEVLSNLRGTQGCTHLNDALRALAEVPKLAQNI